MRLADETIALSAIATPTEALKVDQRVGAAKGKWDLVVQLEAS